MVFRGLNLELDRETNFSVFYVIYKVSYTTKLRTDSQKIDSNQDVFDAALDPGGTATSSGSSK